MGLSKIKEYGNMVMFSHSIFSLPFGLLSMIFAYGGIPPIRMFVLILVALLAARNGANAFNRIADKDIDKKNPRTKDRHLPTGKIKNWEAYAIVILCFLIFAVAAYMLNVVCLILSPLAIAIFVFYSYSKRITWLCHYVLGAACGGAPVGAWLAVTGGISLVPLIMAASVCFWIAGFDIIYGTQDIEFDRAEKLYSIPARFGLKNALLISTVSHIMSVIMLCSLPFFVKELGIIYYIGIGCISILLFIEHYNVSPENTKKMKFISYSINQVISILFLIFTLADYFM